MSTRCFIVRNTLGKLPHQPSASESPTISNADVAILPIFLVKGKLAEWRRNTEKLVAYCRASELFLLSSIDLAITLDFV